jgi:hypothetical protein
MGCRVTSQDFAEPETKTPPTGVLFGGDSFSFRVVHQFELRRQRRAARPKNGRLLQNLRIGATVLWHRLQSVAFHQIKAGLDHLATASSMGWVLEPHRLKPVLLKFQFKLSRYTLIPRIAFKACDDLGLGPHPIVQVERFNFGWLHEMNDFLRAAREC